MQNVQIRPENERITTGVIEQSVDSSTNMIFKKIAVNQNIVFDFDVDAIEEKFNDMIKLLNKAL